MTKKKTKGTTPADHVFHHVAGRELKKVARCLRVIEHQLCTLPFSSRQQMIKQLLNTHINRITDLRAAMHSIAAATLGESDRTMKLYYIDMRPKSVKSRTGGGKSG